MRWDVGRTGRNGKEGVVSPDGEGPRIQVQQTELNLRPDPFKQHLGQEAGLITFSHRVTHLEPTEPRACAREPAAITVTGLGPQLKGSALASHSDG